MKTSFFLQASALILTIGVTVGGTTPLAFGANDETSVGETHFTGGEFFEPVPSSQSQNKALHEYHPQSSIESREDVGRVVHTHIRFIVAPEAVDMTPFSNDDAKTNMANLNHFGAPSAKPAAAPATAVVMNTPSSIACIYELVAQPPEEPAGCNPAYTTVNPAGGGGAIAIVDAYDDPTAAADLSHFSSYFGLPAANFEVVYVGGKSPYISGSRPPANTGWELEEALDIEWAHAMAPSAKLFLVEAPNTSFSGLFEAIEAAEYLVNENGGGEISMSWGSSEFSGETSYDNTFSSAKSNVVFLASAGDTGGVVSYPASSPYVIGVGGTTVFRNSGDNFTLETTWTSGGGGVSCCESRPAFQTAKATETIVGTHRGTPDVALDANPSSGVAVYFQGNWYLVGGTSVSSPTMAGILNVAADHEVGSFPSAVTELDRLYTNGSSNQDFRDITSGGCGSHVAQTGFDLCTGWGSAITYKGK